MFERKTLISRLHVERQHTLFMCLQYTILFTIQNSCRQLQRLNEGKQHFEYLYVSKCLKSDEERSADETH